MNSAYWLLDIFLNHVVVTDLKTGTLVLNVSWCVIRAVSVQIS